jgi:integrase
MIRSSELVAVLKAHKGGPRARAHRRGEPLGGPRRRIRAGERPSDRSTCRLQEWPDILADAGLPHLGVHAMRHSAATIALDEGVALAVVQELLGHSDIRVLHIDPASAPAFIGSCPGSRVRDSPGQFCFPAVARAEDLT